LVSREVEILLLRIYYNIDAGEGYFPAMETLHKRKQYNFRRTISQPLNQTLDMV
jgi:hypothetical protein